MVATDYTADRSNGQTTCSFSEYEAVFTNLEDTGLLQRLEAYHLVGRRGHSLRALWRSYLYAYLRGFPSTNGLIRELRERPDLRIFLGFRTLPHRTTFNRFFNRLSYHTDLVEQVLGGVTAKLKALLPDLGDEVAVDSTVIASHSRPRTQNKEGVIVKESSDPEAGWTPKNSPRAKDDKIWFWGFKMHTVADVNHDIPLAQFLTTANRNDSPELPNLIAKAEVAHSWFKPSVAVGDKGYDSLANHTYLYEKGIIPIIHLRKPAKGRLHKGAYNEAGVPVCVGKVPMRYALTDPKSGHRLYRCAGCHLKNSVRGGIRHCDWEVWEDPMKDIRIHGVVRRQSIKWKDYYTKRQGIERVFKSMKESRRLDKHCFRGLRKVTLHAMLSTLMFQVTALVNRQMKKADVGWQVQRVA